MQKFLILSGVALFLFLVIYVSFVAPLNTVKEWMTAHHLVPRSIERRLMLVGPFFPNKDAAYYRVETTNGRILWFKVWIWGTTVREETKNSYINFVDTPGKI